MERGNNIKRTATTSNKHLCIVEAVALEHDVIWIIYSMSCNELIIYSEPQLSGPHLSGLLTYPDTCLGTNYDYIYRESDSFIRIFSYPDSQFGNGGVRINEGSL